ncbi:bifunctional D-altronate/D-mannonate dehydratase [Sedimentisphaera cyanobacteriorum]|uniref:Bifunctional D-altronate/D-mannonate dehydratase n=1 Tax=Sedimentisphaera cyanobacteriorum TaxID=1940790 RepID=A0A1Q2HQU1_9BACT|nr:enolase C-terminal domain-like protein [Sedimentisphaera cyanobacteriorum]AQQ09818.1 bifunctional D-altronate/D-mannonate dehydratase [Sedimentisphaera cyanobacteriorum]
MKRREFLQASAAAAALGSSSAASAKSPSEHSQALSEHKISSIQYDRVKLNYPRHVGRNSRLGHHGRGPTVSICKIRTNKGAEGWGVFPAGRDRAGFLNDSLKGIKISELISPASGIKYSAPEQLDIALHDLAGKILDMPVYKMLGAEGPASTNCYSGMIYFDDLDPEDNPAGIDKVLENCRYDYNFGYRQFKIKIGRGKKWMPEKEGMQRDIDVTNEIAKAFPYATLLADANDMYTYQDTIEYLKGIGDTELYWMEEPFREEEEGFRKLKKWLKESGKSTFIADGEWGPVQAQLISLAKKGLLDYYLTDIIGLGFSPWRDMMPRLKKMSILASPHAWGSMLKTCYISHLSRGLGNIPTIEGVTCFSDDVDFSGFEIENGKISTPETPGFGLKLLKS